METATGRDQESSEQYQLYFIIVTQALGIGDLARRGKLDDLRKAVQSRKNEVDEIDSYGECRPSLKSNLSASRTKHLLWSLNPLQGTLH